MSDRVLELRDWLTSGRAEQLRVSAEIPRSIAAADIEVSEIALYRWERGDRFPRGRNALRYHRFLARLARAERGRVA